MDSASRLELLQRYREGPRLLESAVGPLSDDDLDRCEPGGWSPRMIAHHLADAEMIAATRVRRLVAEEAVAIVAFDEDIWARRAHYERPIATSLAVVRSVRESTAEFLESLSEAEWRRSGTHSLHDGPYSPETWLAYYAGHLPAHVRQLEDALKR